MRKIVPYYVSLAAILAVIGFATPVNAAAQEGSAPKWKGHIEAEGKWSADRKIGETGLFAPIWQDEDSMFFTDLRGRLDQKDSQEYNLGFGYRQMLNNDWILGGYGFYDRRRTSLNNMFDQATFGLEAMSENTEARLNVYIPENTEKGAGGATGPTAIVSGGQIQIRTTGGGQERAMPGFDVEVGRKIDMPDNWSLWMYGGGFYFDADDYKTVAGPRGRVEVSYDNVPYLGDGSRFTLGAETQSDGVRGGQTFGIARLRIPLSFGTAKKSYAALSPLEQRMTGRIIRDVDIVAGQKAGPISLETATATTAGGSTVSSVTIIDANTANPVTALTNAGTNALVLFDGAAGTINTGGSLSALTGQTIMGGGQQISVTGTTSGTTLNLTLPGSRPTISRTGASNVFNISGRTNVKLQGLDIQNGNDGVSVSNSSNVTLSDLNISDTTNSGIFFSSSSGTVQDTSVDNPGTNGLAVLSASTVTATRLSLTNTEDSAVFVGSAVTNLTVSDTEITGADYGIFSYNSATLTLNNTDISDAATGIYLRNTTASGSGNTISASATGCNNNGGNTGSIAFDDINGSGPTTCP